jgi:hypothetical protein
VLEVILGVAMKTLSNYSPLGPAAVALTDVSVLQDEG